MQDLHLVPATRTIVPHPSRHAWSFALRGDVGDRVLSVTRPVGGFYSIMARAKDGVAEVRVSEIASGLAFHLVPLAGGGIACTIARTDSVRDVSLPGLPLVGLRSSDERIVFGPDDVPLRASAPDASMSTDRSRVVLDVHEGGLSLLELVMDFPDGNLRVHATNGTTVSATFLDSKGVVLEGAPGRVDVPDPDPMGRRRGA